MKDQRSLFVTLYQIIQIYYVSLKGDFLFILKFNWQNYFPGATTGKSLIYELHILVTGWQVSLIMHDIVAVDILLRRDFDKVHLNMFAIITDSYENISIRIVNLTMMYNWHFSSLIPLLNIYTTDYASPQTELNVLFHINIHLCIFTCFIILYLYYIYKWTISHKYKSRNVKIRKYKISNLRIIISELVIYTNFH